MYRDRDRFDLWHVIFVCTLWSPDAVMIAPWSFIDFGAF